MKGAFKIGDKVRVTVDCSRCGVKEVNGGLGMVGEITRIQNNLVWAKSDSFLNGDKYSGWCFKMDQVEVAMDKEPKAQASYNTVCPRCKAPAYIGLSVIECSRHCE